MLFARLFNINGEIRFFGSAVNKQLSENRSGVRKYTLFKQYVGCYIEVYYLIQI